MRLRWKRLAVILPVFLLVGCGAFRAAAPAAFSTPIRHIVVILQENHSFDNVLGAFCVLHQRCNGAASGILYGGARVQLAPAGDIVAVVAHDVAAQHIAIDGGKMDGFSRILGCTSTYAYACYTHYLPSQIPNVAKLATTYALSDRTFEDGAAPSWGSHLSAVTANFDGFTGDNPAAAAPTPSAGLGPGWGCNSNRDAPWISPGATAPTQVPACVPDHSLNTSTYPNGGAYRPTPVRHIPTIMDRLAGAGLSWKIYMSFPSAPSNGYGWAICPTFAGCIDTNQSANMVSNTTFVNDAKAGRLPNFSIVTPDADTSQHNSYSMAAGDNWIGSLVQAIGSNATQWQSTAIFIAWDDCGCFYDHVAPPSGLGIRVPMLMVSPYAIAAHTDSNAASFASVLAFTEHAYGLTALNGTDANAYNYLHSFNFAQTPAPPPVMTATAISPEEQQLIDANPPATDDPT